MKATAKKVYGNDSLTGKKIGVQGIGQVGKHLVEYLVKEHADVFITDIFEDKVKAVAKELHVTGVAPDSFYDKDMDIYAPCALGATINDDTIARLNCSIIAGAANNQLKDETRHGFMLIDKSITYAPDFLINAGGLINVYHEHLGNYNRKRVFEQVENIYTTCTNILTLAGNEKITSQEAAIKLSEKRIAQIGRIRQSF